MADWIISFIIQLRKHSGSVIKENWLILFPERIIYVSSDSHISVYCKETECFQSVFF